MCKVIENKMIQAINARRNFQLTNTKVINNSCGVFVLLYSTLIYANVRGQIYYSDGGFNTVTTASRLRSLGADYSINEKRNNCKLRTQKEMYNLYYFGRLKS